MRFKRLSLAVLVTLALVGLLIVGCKQDQPLEIAAVRERIAIDAREDSYIYNGADLKFYSDDHSTAKIYLMGDSGNVGVGGTLAVTGSVSLNGTAAFVSQLKADNGLRVTQNITQVSGSSILNSLLVSSTLSANTIASTDAVTVGGALKVVGASTLTGTVTSIGAVNVGSVLSANTIQSTNAVTVGAGLDVVGALEVTGTVDLKGVLSSDGANMFRINENVVITGDLTVSGAASYATASFSAPLSDAGDLFRINDNTLLTGTLAVQGAVSDQGDTFRINDPLIVTGSVTFDGASIISDANNSVRINDNVLMTGTLGVSGDLTAGAYVSANSLASTDAVTVGGTLDVVGAVEITGTLDAKGVISSNGTNILRFNDNALVTGTLGVSSLLSPGNGVAATGNVTVTGNVTTSAAIGALSFYGGISTTIDYTSTETIVFNGHTIIPVTAGGPGATLAADVSISNGTYYGQLLYIVNVDATAGHTVIVKNAANTHIGKDRTLDIDDVLVLYWDGSDWRLLSLIDASA